MIELYTGAPGSFKSYHATERGLAKIGAFMNNNVVANFPIKEKKKGKDRGEWFYVDNDELTPTLLIRRSLKNGYFGHEGACLLIIDEAALKFNARDWQENAIVRKSWIKFFALSRHFGYDIILVAQEERMVDRQIRKLAEFNVKHVNLRSHWLLKYIVWWKMFVSVSFWMAGNFKGQATVGIFKPWVANRYDSIRAFDSSPEMVALALECGINLETGKSAGLSGGVGVPSRRPRFPFGRLFQRHKNEKK